MTKQPPSRFRCRIHCILGVWIIMATPFLMYWMMGVTQSSQRNAKEMAGWPTVVGTSENATLEKHMKVNRVKGGRIPVGVTTLAYDYDIRADFSFEVEGTKYRAQEFEQFDEEVKANQFYDSVARGKTATIHYNPKDPSHNAVNYNVKYEGASIAFPATMAGLMGMFGLFVSVASFQQLRRA